MKMVTLTHPETIGFSSAMTEQQPVRQSARMAIDLARLDELPLNVAQGFVEVVLGTKLNWNGADAPCVCPGLSMHTKPNAPTDCHVIAIKAESGIAPGVYCHQGSCREVCAEVSQTLRKALGTQAQPFGAFEGAGGILDARRGRASNRHADQSGHRCLRSGEAGIHRPQARRRRRRLVRGPLAEVRDQPYTGQLPP
jgi:hypothetical protein